MRHIVDILIEERATKLMKNPRIWSFVQSRLYPYLKYQEAKELIDQVTPMGGRDIFDHLGKLLNLNLKATGLKNIPAAGRAILMPNHPSGIADGVAVYEAIKSVRQDIKFFANRDAVRCAPTLKDIIIPVEWMEHRRDHTKSKETVKSMIQAFKEEKLIVIFASGKLARPTPLGLIERPWLTSGVSLAQKYDCPIVPMHIKASNSFLYYLFWFLNTEIKDMTLFRELLNKVNSRYYIKTGKPISSNEDPETLTPKLRHYVISELKRGNEDFSI